MISKNTDAVNYKIIDPLIATLSGGFVAFAVARMVPDGFSLLPGMLAGGFCGMALQLVLMFLLMPFLGAFEVMIPLSLIGMTVGMMSGMMAAWGGIAVFGIAWAGAVAGLLVSAVIHYCNRRLTSPP
ncbi:MAG: hypothetical protein ACE5G9_04485 [Nitrospinales bacterium]